MCEGVGATQFVFPTPNKVTDAIALDLGQVGLIRELIHHVSNAIFRVAKQPVEARIEKGTIELRTEKYNARQSRSATTVWEQTYFRKSTSR